MSPLYHGVRECDGLEEPLSAATVRRHDSSYAYMDALPEDGCATRISALKFPAKFQGAFFVTTSKGKFAALPRGTAGPIINRS
jgi:hypothetical protein